MKQRSAGFTLIEVMIALLIFAVAASTLLLSDGHVVRRTAQVQDRMVANWLADQAINHFYQDAHNVQVGSFGGYQMFSEQDWYVQSDVKETDKAGFYRVDVTVFHGKELPENKKEAIWDLTGFLRKPLF
ncbi:MAG: type II secretion system minor pseudopilin GspI [Endozoicomonadaceae bacterium]|nr:type II secretion system minor pseudopilin GspI [Endozoicomonadaceae bacterium]